MKIAHCMFHYKTKIRKDQTLNVFRLELGNKISLPFFFIFLFPSKNSKSYFAFTLNELICSFSFLFLF